VGVSLGAGAGADGPVRPAQRRIPYIVLRHAVFPCTTSVMYSHKHFYPEQFAELSGVAENRLPAWVIISHATNVSTRWQCFGESVAYYEALGRSDCE
jgi:hypothetical protein